MNILCFPPAALGAATIAVWLRFASPAIAQEPSTPPAAPGAAPAASTVPLSSLGEDILKLSRAKIGDDVTIAFIQNGARRYSQNASELVYLRTEGVSDRVLTAMLQQQSPAGIAQPLPPATQPAADAFGSAPQYVTPPATSVVEQTSPASTVYVVGSTPTYYSFYDPWPYWYDPWPYSYPYFSIGFAWGWGGCYNGYWNNYWYNGYYGGCGGYYGHKGHNGHNGHHGHDGNNPPSTTGGRGQEPAGRPRVGDRPRGGSSSPINRAPERGGQPGTYASAGRSTAAAGQPGSEAARTAGTAPSGRPTSTWSRTGNSSTVVRVGQPNAVATRGNQAGGPTRSWGSGAENRIIAGPSPAQGGAQSSRPGYTTTRSAAANPTTVRSRPGSSSPMGNRYVGSQASSVQRSAVRPSSGYSGGGNFVSPGRPSAGSSYRGTVNSGGFRGGGSSGGGGARMSSGGGSRGGGGGGARR